jgi:hypothetical protein
MPTKTQPVVSAVVLPERINTPTRPGTSWNAGSSRWKRLENRTLALYEPGGMQETSGALPRQGSSRVNIRSAPTSRRPMVAWSSCCSRKMFTTGSFSTRTPKTAAPAECWALSGRYTTRIGAFQVN